MPIKHFLEQYEHNPETFDFAAFKKQALEEYEQDETTWNAAVSTRDESQKKTAAELQEARAKAWDLLQQIPAKQDEKTAGQQPDTDPTNVQFTDIFTPVERK